VAAAVDRSGGPPPGRYLAPVGGESLHQLLWREHEARARAEAANRAKDGFPAAMSHELGSPRAPAASKT
jgi:hypothetical protein